MTKFMNMNKEDECKKIYTNKKGKV